ncbi:uncharacterized protein N7518_003175 [Penicillium psychrosexuale]|uniref:uncharacterized protein n=1 Tax=Penicillium psychrosexuale TaxID=1002107 RepID=UPI0025458955|nr:uncharacterized protein N7518_003175 [Penicillium psychrosexuale]KAJ5801107.1 hypothetical protein N7518_003175 [Penicillium psychrosexuale]
MSLFLPVPSACAENTPTTRHQWCEHDLYTDYTKTTPETGVTREFWLDIDQATLAPDGRSRWGLTINGSLPGPTLEVNWGDEVVIHLRNSLPNTVHNGTSLHIHGLRQHYTNPMDGVVSVTQCPVPLGYTMTYRWRATQYGTTWYHSHIGLQTWEGVYGGLIIHGPASSNYDEDKGVIQLSDWDISTVDQLWHGAETVGSPVLDNALINGVNVFGNDSDPSQTGYRFNTSFTPGMSYRLRVTNVACDTHFKFSIDHHILTVIAMDLVPIQPYNTTAVSLAIGQRYDVIVHADQASTAKSFWLRAVPQLSCSSNSNADNIRGIIYYTHTDKPTLPTTEAYNLTDTCEDEPAPKLTPIISTPLVLTAEDFFYNETLSATTALTPHSVYRWYLNSTSMQGKWAQPTLRNFSAESSIADKPAVIAIPQADTWVLVVIETSMDIAHPIHLHGHDFLVVAQGYGSWDGSTSTSKSYAKSTGRDQDTSTGLNLDFAAGALPKRDTALLPGMGYLVLAFRSDNPGAWLMHCHIGWHLDQGFALQFVERGEEIEGLLGGRAVGGAGADWRGFGDGLERNCRAWDLYHRGNNVLEDGAGI